ncbi:MAG TPA: hypothetical protein VN848_07730 [Gemmatimonadales bacterium]|nr:hypothetical protein [Gemmatimonadales bacterium]
MFIGHYALGLAAKRIAPRTSLGALIAAPTFADLLWPLFLLLGWERVSITPSADPFYNLTFDSYPISHSLLALVGWGVVFGGLYGLRTRYQAGAVVLFLLVVSHWVLDYVVHRPDLPIVPGGARVGLGLWASVPATLVLEVAMFVAGAFLYLAGTRARDAIGRYGVWALLVVLVLSYVSTLFAGPPSSARVIGVGGLVFGWLFVAWAAWADRHREVI